MASPEGVLTKLSKTNSASKIKNLFSSYCCCLAHRSILVGGKRPQCAIQGIDVLP